ncbi:Ligase-interacting factor 1 [Nakaseomyces bracarensis]|uniref:Ligase-interacting factor 1 n=1 Tax=Nakaseomyces bracarensis TaxID=273131 RepID=A0ABR4NNS0_9SACH
MYYSSCFDVEGKDDVIVLCRCELVQDIDSYVVRDLSFSDGERIFERKVVNKNGIKLHVEESQRDLIWDGFIRALSAKSLPDLDRDDAVEEKEPLYSKIICVPTSDHEGRLVMISQVGVITRRLAELEVQVTEEAELDLFLLAKQLYDNLCDSNVKSKVLDAGNKNLELDVDNLREEIETIKHLTLERDRKVNSIMVGLLNEKKKKIRQLKHLIQISGIEVPEEDHSDSEFINKYVTDEVSELNSPGKRRVAAWKDTRPIKRLKPVRRKLDIKEEHDDAPVLKHSDDFDDFKFLGISKSPEKKLTVDKEESDSDHESLHRDPSHHEDSLSSIDIKKEFSDDDRIDIKVPEGSIPKANSSSEDTDTDIENSQKMASSNSGNNYGSSEDTDTGA